MRFLSLAGRQVLIQSVINSIPNYAMQTMYLPKGVCDTIDKLTRNFLRGGDGQNIKVSLVKWRDATRLKEEDGLGLKSVRHMNVAFLTKLGWRIIKVAEKPWAQVIAKKYMKRGVFVTNMKRKKGDSNIWKGICAATPYIAGDMKKIVRNGRDTLFWTD